MLQTQHEMKTSPITHRMHFPPFPNPFLQRTVTCMRCIGVVKPEAIPDSGAAPRFGPGRCTV